MEIRKESPGVKLVRALIQLDTNSLPPNEGQFPSPVNATWSLLVSGVQK